jgi:hypothetical protein
MKILPVSAELFHADGQTETGREINVTKLIVTFLNFVNAPENECITVFALFIISIISDVTIKNWALDTPSRLSHIGQIDRYSRNFVLALCHWNTPKPYSLFLRISETIRHMRQLVRRIDIFLFKILYCVKFYTSIFVSEIITMIHFKFSTGSTLLICLFHSCS